MKTLWSILLLSSAFIQASQDEKRNRIVSWGKDVTHQIEAQDQELQQQIQQDIEVGPQAIEQQFQQMLNPQPSALSPEDRAAYLERQLQEQRQKLMKTAGVVIVSGAGIYGLYNLFFKK